MAARKYTHDTLEQVSELLKKNPEYYTIWNYRRLIRQHEFAQATSSSDQPEADQIIPTIKSDLEFLFPLLRSFPKCYWIWNYRLWILNEAKRLLPRQLARQFWEGELALLGKMLNADSRNFHGWGYRTFVIEALEDLADAGEPSMTQAQIDYTTKMIKTNLSNFSAWHYRTKAIQKLLNEKNASDEERRQVLEQGNFRYETMIPPWLTHSTQNWNCPIMLL
jgi:geranylgeranyl transferase type-2 subunit alpha